MVGSGQNQSRKRVGMIGTGFADIEVARCPSGSQADVTLARA